MLFWFLSALLTVVAILALTKPLSARPGEPGVGRTAGAGDLDIYRDQLKEIEVDRARGILDAEEAAAARLEVSRRLLARADVLEGTAAAGAPSQASSRAILPALYGIAAGLPLIALSLYLYAGAPGLPSQPSAERIATAPQESARIELLVAQVEARLREWPDDGQGWDVIAPVYHRLQRHREAADAYAHAIRLLGESPRRLAGFAEATIIHNNGLVTEPARAAFEKILKLEPGRLEARFWLAQAKEQDGDLAGAAADYRAMLAETPDDAPGRAVLQERLQEIASSLASAPKSPVSKGPSATDVAAAQKLSQAERGQMIAGMVEGLAARLETNGKDLAGWQRLLNAYAVLGQRDKAGQALAAARKALSDDQRALAELDTLAKSLGL